MSEYSKKTVAELQSILRSHGITPTGKKADLVARLEEYDASNNKEADSQPAGETASTLVDPSASTEQPSTATQPPNVASKDGQTLAPATTTETVSAELPQSFAANLAASNVDEELEKRKKRAARFNTGNEPTADATTGADDEAERALARAKKFGTESDAMSKLDQALSTEREGNRGRRGKDTSATEATVFDDPGLKRGFGRRQGRGRGGRSNGSDRPSGVQKSAGISDKDKLAAESRRKRFAAAS